MRKNKISLQNKSTYMGLLILTVVFGSLFLFLNKNLSDFLTASMLGQYKYNSAPIDYEASNFVCNPGPRQPDDGSKYANTYNTYWHSYADPVWCGNWSDNTDTQVFDDAGNWIENNGYEIRHAAHIAEAKRHENIPVIYERILDGYGTYYVTGGYEGTNPTPNQYSGFYPKSVVHCPDGAQVVDHTTYGKALSQAHLYNQNENEGEYDGSGHKWCELNGTAVAPLPGPDPSKGMPDVGSSKASLYKFTFPDSNLESVDYYKYYKNSAISGIYKGSDWVKCEYGIAGPFYEGVNTHTVSIYDSEENKNRAKTPHYHCLGVDGTFFVDPIKDEVGPPSPYNTIYPVNFKSNIMYSENTCSAGDDSCGGADTVGATGPCSRGTFYCQTTDAAYRYCSSTPDCTGKFTPPSPVYAVLPPQNPRLDHANNVKFNNKTETTQTVFETGDTCYVKAEFQATGDFPFGTMVETTTKISTSNTDFSNPVKIHTVNGTVNTNGEYIGGFCLDSSVPIGGPYYFCMENTYDNVTTECAVSSDSFTVVAAQAVSTADNTSSTEEGSGSTAASAAESGSGSTAASAAESGSGSTTASPYSTDIISATTNTASSAIITSTGSTATATPEVSIPTEATPTMPTEPIQCYIGKKCPSGSWCNNGKSCYYTTGELTCIAWNQQKCPAGTSVCNPTDKQCINPGEYGGLDGWCSDSMECYTDDSRKFCQPWDNMSADTAAMKPMKCPSNMFACRPGDDKCIEPGEYGSIDGWCQHSMECYTKDGKQKYCYQNSDPESMNGECPSGFNSCRPNDSKCIEIGDTGPSDGWCGGYAKQCFTSSGLYCAKQDESCPEGAGSCRRSDTNCVEPGQYGLKDSWCGGNAVYCYKKDNTGIYCAEVTDTDPFSWENVKCPLGTSRCRSDDQYCLELGETGSESSWCAAGRPKPNNNGTITCVSASDALSAEAAESEVAQICIQVLSTAYDPATRECKTFSTPCNIPEGWKKLETDQTCRDGKIEYVNDVIQDKNYIVDKLKYDKQYLTDLKYQLKKVPPVISDQAGKILVLIEEGLNEIEDILIEIGRASLSGKNSIRASIQDRIKLFDKNILADIKQRMDDIRPYLEFAFLDENVHMDLNRYKNELKKADRKSNFYKELGGYVKKLEGLIESAKNQKGEALKRILESIQKVRDFTEKIIQKKHDAFSKEFIDETIKNLKSKLSDFNDIIDKKGDYVSRGTLRMISRFELAVESLSDMRDEGVPFRKMLKFIDRAAKLRDILAEDLGVRKASSKEREIKDVLLENLDDALAEKVSKEVLSKVADKLTIMLSKQMQEIAVKIAQLEKSTKSLKEQLSQSLSNLTSVGEKIRDEIVETKNVVLEKVDRTREMLAAADLKASQKTKLEQIMELSSTVNWCGTVGEKIQSKINSMSLALEAGELKSQEIDMLKKDVEKLAQDNNEECYKIGASDFRDTPMHEWYFGPAQFNSENGYIKGEEDKYGKLLGKFSPARSTLRIEALTMAMRIFGISMGDSKVLKRFVPGVPRWGIPYVNGAIDAGINIDWDKMKSMDQPVTRLEAAVIFTAVGRKYITLPNVINNADDYKDYNSFSGDIDKVRAVEALTDLGVFQGYEGNFNPFKPLLRSEFATVNMRLVENLGIAD